MQLIVLRLEHLEPQGHCRPHNIHCCYNVFIIFFYPTGSYILVHSDCYLIHFVLESVYERLYGRQVYICEVMAYLSNLF